MGRKFIEIEDKDRQDLRICFQTINIANDMLDKNSGFNLLDEQQLREYLSGICEVLISARVTLHNLRKLMSEKYDVDYDFSFDGERIIL